jgi:tol-pal system protein YbgF
MRVLVLVLCLLGGINAAQAAFFSDDEARKQIGALQQQLTQLQAKLDEELKQQQAVEGRVQTLEKSQGLVDLLGQIERINGEVNKLKGQIEVMSHDVEITQKRQRDLYTDLDGRLRKLEGGPATAAAVPAAPSQAPTPAAGNPAAPAVAPAVPPSAAATPAVAPVAAPPADAAAELKAYEAAHNLFKSGKYKESAEAFEKFLETYPGSKYAPSAQYWIGYAHFARKDYKAAITSQQKLIKQYPEHQKAPDAMFNIANSQIQLADIDAAKQTLRTLIEKYPLSDAAPLAKKRLGALESVKAKN